MIRMLALLPLALAACSAPETADAPDVQEAGPTWEAYLAQTYKEPGEHGVWIVDGDIPVASEKALRELWEQRHGGDDATLIVHQEAGADVRWSASERHALTYCISDDFGDDKAAVVDAMSEATEAWEAVADVDFTYVSTEDADCDAENPDVLFDVNPSPADATYFARAFFPNDGRTSRNVLISAGGLAPDFGALTTVGVLRHELGHALGFRHEHTRPEAGTGCYEDDNWRALSTYDRASVMHYPHCEGTEDWTLDLTLRDAYGAASLYGAPDGTDPVEPDRGASVGFFLESSYTMTFPALDVEPGSSVRVAMTGWGDADLYVAFDHTPTLSSYACRPYTDSAFESCALDVPMSASELHIWVVGYTNTAVNVEVGWIGDGPGLTGDLLSPILDVANFLDEDTLVAEYPPGSTVPDAILDNRPFATFSDLMDTISVDDAVRLNAYDGPLDTRGPHILFAANHATFRALDEDAGLDRRAARGLVDGRPFDTVEQVDAVKYVGGAALDRLAEWGEANADKDEAALILEVANNATLAELDEDVPLDARAARGIVAARPFEDLASLDEVPYVGTVAMERMYAWGIENL